MAWPRMEWTILTALPVRRRLTAFSMRALVCVLLIDTTSYERSADHPRAREDL